MGQTTDQLRQEIDDKRDDAAAKIDEIEARVQGTAQLAKDTVEETMVTARETVEETMATAKSTVEETVTETVDTIKQGFDFQKQIDERPLVMLGAAAVGGFILGGLGGDKSRRSHYYPEHHSGPGPLQQAVHSTGLDSTMSAVTGALVGMAADRLRGVVDESFPEFGQRLRQEMDTKSSASRSQHRPGSSGLPPATGPSGSEGTYREPLA